MTIQTVPSKTPRLTKYHEGSGLTIVKLADCSFEDAVSWYIRLQQSNPLFISLGIVGIKLQKYAEFIAKVGTMFPYNIAAIDDSGKIEGMFISCYLSEVDDSKLSGGAKEHWKLFKEVDKAMRSVFQCQESIRMCIIIAMMPKYQAKGLFKELSTVQGDLVAAEGVQSFLTYTANPNFMRAYQKMISPRTKLSKTLAENLFESRPSIVNRDLLPRYTQSSILPADMTFLALDLASLIEVPAPKIIVGMAGPPPTSEYVARSSQYSRL